MDRARTRHRGRRLAAGLPAVLVAGSAVLAGQAGWATAAGAAPLVAHRAALRSASPTPNVFIADTYNNDLVEVPSGGGAQTVLASGLTLPGGVALDGSGNMFVSEPTVGQVLEVPAGGGTPTTVATGLNYPRGLAVDSSGNLFIADSRNNQIVEVPAGGGTATVAVSGLNIPYAVTVDSSGNLFIGDTGADQVEEFSGGTLTTLLTGLNHPRAVAVDGAGNLFIANTDSSQVLELAPGSSTPTTVTTDVGHPYGLAVDHAGDVLVADTTNNRVIEVPAGGGTSIPIGSNLNFPQGVALTEAPRQTPTLTVTGPSGSTPYGGSPSTTPTYSTSDGSTATPATLPTCTGMPNSTSSVGAYTTTCSGAADPNYNIAYADGTDYVTAATLAITAGSPRFAYGLTNHPVHVASYSGFVNGDTPSVLSGPVACSADITATSPEGAYPTSCGAATADNYAVLYLPGLAHVVAGYPTLSTTIPAGNAVYSVNQGVTVSFSCTAAGGATLKSCTGSQPNGVPLSTSKIGKHYFTIVATDTDGHAYNHTFTYSVVR